jgi:dipeptidyl aminopeptidase/acylaminoacyl peptidase
MSRITYDSGLTTEPSISSDGRLVAYASNRSGDGNLDIYLQQIGGGASIRVTNDPADDRDPSVSPDGTLVAFRSDRNPRGIYVVAALGSGARLIGPDGLAPRFSPDGKLIVYWTGTWLAPRSLATVRRVFVIPAAGGAPVQVGKDLASAGDVVWSPDGKAVLAYGRRSITGPDTAPDWWWIPIDGGASVATGVYARLQASGIEIDVTDIQPYPGSWMDEGVIFPAQLKGADGRGLWRVPVDRRSGRVTGSPVQVTNDTTIDGERRAHGVCGPVIGRTAVWYAARRKCRQAAGPTSKFA